MARDNTRVAQAFLIIAREHSGCSARWERTLSRILAIATAAAGSCKGFLHLFAWHGQNVVYQLTAKSIS
jgi:hypothetical protein